jgi:hypothetical protein
MAGLAEMVKKTKTPGTQIAERLRSKANFLTGHQRAKHRKAALKIIFHT